MGIARKKYANGINMIIGNMIYLVILALFKRDITPSVVTITIFIFLAYYIFDSYNILDSQQLFMNFVRAIVVNFVFAVITLLVTSDIIFVVTLYTVTLLYQLISRFLYVNFLSRKLSIVQIGSAYKNDLIINLISQTRRYEVLETIEIHDEKGNANGIDKLREIINLGKTDILIINFENMGSRDYIKEILEMKMHGIRVMDFTEFYERESGKLPVKAINEEWLLYSRGFNILHDSFKQRVKRLFDFLFAFTLLMITFPIMIVSAIIIKLESKGPVFFMQDRVGKDNKIFKIVKFRSMKVHDETKHSMYAGEKDSRITKFGGFMRKTRIDELPQLWNILKGDMSFIGPRAEWSKLCFKYMEQIPFYSMRHSVLPGITGWAQVNYKYGASVDDAFEKLQYDLYYIKNYSLVLDIVIIFKTMKTVIFGRGR